MPTLCPQTVSDERQVRKILDVSLRHFARSEQDCGKLTSPVSTRFPRSLAAFMRTSALVEGVSESSLIRYCCVRWAREQGYTRTCV